MEVEEFLSAKSGSTIFMLFTHGHFKPDTRRMRLAVNALLIELMLMATTVQRIVVGSRK